MATESRTVLVLTNDSGMGHRHAATATIAAIEQRYGDSLRAALANPFEERSAPTALQRLQTDFSEIVQRAPALYRLGHNVGNNAATTWLMERATTRLMLETIDDILTRRPPDLIVITHPAFIYTLVSYRREKRQSWPIVVLVTDLARLQRLWFREEVDLYLLPTPEAAELAARRGIDPARVRITGIPVDLRLAARTTGSQELRRGYGWDEALPTFLAVGSRRIHEFQRFLLALNEARLPIQLVIVAGDDEELMEEMRGVTWQMTTHVYGYLEDFPARLLAADGIITKAGGLTTAESLAAGLPLFIVQSTPMHEQGNADYVVAAGAGVCATNPAALVAAVRDSLDDEHRGLAQMAAAASRIGRPRAAEHVAVHLWTLATQTTAGETAEC